MDVSGSDFDHDKFFITALAVGMKARDKVFIGIDDDDLWALDLRVAPEVVLETIDYGSEEGVFFLGSAPKFRREMRIYYTYRNLWTGAKLRASDDDMNPWASADGEKIMGLETSRDLIKTAADWYIEFGDVNQIMCGDLSAPQAVKQELLRRGFEGFRGDEDEKSCPLP
jgi:hypothetical protein